MGVEQKLAMLLERAIDSLCELMKSFIKEDEDFFEDKKARQAMREAGRILMGESLDEE